MKDKGVTGVGVFGAAPILIEVNDQTTKLVSFMCCICSATTSTTPKGVAFLNSCCR